MIENSSAKFQILEELVSNNTVFKADNDSQLLVILLNQLRLQAEADRQEYILAQEKRYSNHKTIIHDITVDPVLRDTLIEYYAYEAVSSSSALTPKMYAKLHGKGGGSTGGVSSIFLFASSLCSFVSFFRFLSVYWSMALTSGTYSVPMCSFLMSRSTWTK